MGNPEKQSDLENQQVQNDQTKSDLLNNPKALEGKSGNQAVGIMKDDINDRLTNINDEETKQQISNMLNGEKFIGNLTEEQAKELSSIYNKIDKLLSTEHGENAKSQEEAQKSNEETSNDYAKKLLESVKELKDFIDNNNIKAKEKQRQNAEKARKANSEGGKVQIAEREQAESSLDKDWPPSVKESPSATA